MLYSKSTNGFYDSSINPVIPSDAVQVSDEQIKALFEAQQQGKVIQADANGYPEAVSLAPTQQQLFDLCSAKAKELLAKSDWAVLPDVGLKNSADFVYYRGILRAYIINPVTNPDFPVAPTAVWQ
jgi:hypothetical protein